MVASLWPAGGDGSPSLPEPNVEVACSGTPPDELTPEAIHGMLMNPIYAGVGPFPPLVSDAQWVAACRRILQETDSVDQFLVNLLFVLRESLGTHEDYESPDGQD